MPDGAPTPLEITACPECGLPAEITDRVAVAGTSGPVDLIRTMCVRRHWFMLDADRSYPVALRLDHRLVTIRRRGAGG